MTKEHEIADIVVYLKLPSRETIKRKHTTALHKTAGEPGGEHGGEHERGTGRWMLRFPTCNPPCVRRREFENPQTVACGNKLRSPWSLRVDLLGGGAERSVAY